MSGIINKALRGFGTGMAQVGEMYLQSNIEEARQKRLADISQQYRSTERAEDREFTKEQSSEDREFRRKENEENRKFQEGMAEKGHEYRKEEIKMEQDHKEMIEKLKIQYKEDVVGIDKRLAQLAKLGSEGRANEAEMREYWALVGLRMTPQEKLMSEAMGGEVQIPKSPFYKPEPVPNPDKDGGQPDPTTGMTDADGYMLIQNKETKEIMRYNPKTGDMRPHEKTDKAASQNTESKSGLINKNMNEQAPQQPTYEKKRESPYPTSKVTQEELDARKSEEDKKQVIQQIDQLGKALASAKKQGNKQAIAALEKQIMRLEESLLGGQALLAGR